MIGEQPPTPKRRQCTHPCDAVPCSVAALICSCVLGLGTGAAWIDRCRSTHLSISIISTKHDSSIRSACWQHNGPGIPGQCKHAMEAFTSSQLQRKATAPVAYWKKIIYRAVIQRHKCKTHPATSIFHPYSTHSPRIYNCRPSAVLNSAIMQKQQGCNAHAQP